MLLPQQATDMMLGKSVYSSISFYVRRLILFIQIATTSSLTRVTHRPTATGNMR
jgi:hypothetical protein